LSGFFDFGQRLDFQLMERTFISWPLTLITFCFDAFSNWKRFLRFALPLKHWLLALQALPKVVEELINQHHRRTRVFQSTQTEIRASMVARQRL